MVASFQYKRLGKNVAENGFDLKTIFSGRWNEGDILVFHGECTTHEIARDKLVKSMRKKTNEEQCKIFYANMNKYWGHKFFKDHCTPHAMSLSTVKVGSSDYKWKLCDTSCQKFHVLNDLCDFGQRMQFYFHVYYFQLSI